MERVERGQGLELLALVVHSRFEWEAMHSIFEWEAVPQMQAFAPHTIMLAKGWPEPAVVAQAVHKTLLLQTGTSF